MKTMTCKQLGGACDEEFEAETFEEIAQKSKDHGTKMAQAADADHLEAMQEMQNLMTNPQAMTEWFEARKQEFDQLPES